MRAHHLARLIERARPGDDVLQRRQPSRFESPRPAPGPAMDEIDSSTMPAAPRTWAAPSESGPTTFAPIADQPAAREARHSLGHQGQRPPQGPDRHARPEPPSPRETLRVDATLARSTPATPATPHAPPARPVHDSRHGNASAPMLASPPLSPPPLARAQAESAAPAAAAVPARQGGNADHAFAPRPQRDAAPAPQGQPTSSVRAPRTPLLQAPPMPPLRRPEPAQPARAMARAARQSPSTAAQAATPREAPAPVQVTIGRIEVRAVTAPAPPAPSRRAAPRLSLDQYLRERHGGRG
ncbi:hypothetical protein AACH06_23640 [Ideonella sp. DXS29W]|uniref:Uncharacterized protein n=1 Tax=Ideonella lacteola TaxID=2984193 RepID=A0ABU9BWN3_9BURK